MFNPKNARNEGLVHSPLIVGRTPILFCFILAFVLTTFCIWTSPAIAQNQTSYDVYNLTALPDRVAETLVLDLFSAQMLCSGVMLLLWVMPTAIITRSKKASWIPELALVLVILGFEIAVGWLNIFFLVLFCFIVALLMASKARTFITGG